MAKDAKAGNFLRRKSIPRLREELQAIRERYNPDLLYFVDDTFLARPITELRDMAEMYQEFRIPLWNNTRPETITPETIELLVRMNCFRMSLGLEAGNEEFRDKMLYRKMRTAELLKHFDYAANGSVTYSTNMIIGYPDETRDLVFESIELMRQIRGYDSITVSIFTPYSGTSLRNYAEKKGYLDPATITTHTTSRSLLNMPPPYLSADEIDQLMRTFVLYVHMNRQRWAEVRAAETDDEVLAALRSEYQASAWNDSPGSGGVP